MGTSDVVKEHKPQVSIHVLNPNVDTVRKLMRSLQMPTDALPVSIIIPGAMYDYFEPRKRRGLYDYVLELIGTPVNEGEVFPGGFAFEFGELPRVMGWRGRVFYRIEDLLQPVGAKPFYKEDPGRPYLEAMWRPGLKKRLSIRGLEHAKNENDILRAWRGRELLLRLKRGRPVGPGYYEHRDVFKSRLVSAYDEFIKREGRRPSQGDLALELNLGRITLQRYLKEFDVKWPPTW